MFLFRMMDIMEYEFARMPDFMNAQEFIDYRFARHTLLTSDVFDGSSRKGVDANGIPSL